VSYNNLIKVFTADVDRLKKQLSSMDEKAEERRFTEAELAAWRNMGKAMPSKTLERHGDKMYRIRDAVAKVAGEMSTEAQQAFLAGVGVGVRDVSKPSRKKTKKTETDEPTLHNARLSGSDGDARDESEGAEDSSGSGQGMDTSQYPSDK
jgi:hypothetical protein